MNSKRLQKIFILEENISDLILSNPNDSDYSIIVKNEKHNIPDIVEEEVNSNWKNFEKNNVGIASDKTTYFFSSYNKYDNCDYVFPEKFRYVQAFGRSKEFSKYACIAAANNLTALSSLCLILTKDKKMIFGVKENMDSKISGFSGYISNDFVVDDTVDIYRYLVTTIKDELNVSRENIKTIIRIGQAYSPNIVDSNNRLSNKVYNNDFIIKLNISSKDVIDKFQKTFQFKKLIEVDPNDNEFINFIIENENQMSIHCIAAVYNYLIHTNRNKEAKVLIDSLQCKIIPKANAKIGVDKTVNILKRLNIFKWGLIGNSEIKNYSVAPHMWKELFSYLNYPVNYFIIGENDKKIIRDKLNELVNDYTLIGCNIAMPWKRDAFEICEYVDEDIEKFKTINTLVSRDNMIKGYNTDGMGLINSIKEKASLENKVVLIMGAGGGCQTLPLYLMNNRVKSVYICDIVNEKSEILVDNYIDLYREENKVIKSITHDDIPNLIGDVDVIVNATPCGMVGFNNDIAFDKAIIPKLKSNVAIAEMVYNPYLTPLLKCVSEEHPICEGMNMLVEQAAISFYYGFGIELSSESKKIMKKAAEAKLMRKKTILITGSSGFIGSYLVAKLKSKYMIIGVDSKVLSNDQCDYFYNLDITNYDKFKEIFNNYKIDFVIHTAAEKSLVACENNKERSYEINYLGSEFLYNLTKTHGGRFIFISSDQVFDGTEGNYSEYAKTNPINYYGLLKDQFENKLKEDKDAAICRTALTFGIIPESQEFLFDEIKHKEFLVVQGYIVQHVIHKLANKEYINLPRNEFMNPTSVELLYHQITKVIENNLTGILHCCGGERISRYDFGKKIAKSFGLDHSFIKPNDSNNKLRPKDVSLDVKYSSTKLGIKYWDVETMIQKLKSKMK